MKIIRTSEQARLECLKNSEKQKCPECNDTNLGIAMRKKEFKGLFIKKSRTVYRVQCYSCDCIFEYGDEWK